jgi:hypothetical protein
MARFNKGVEIAAKLSPEARAALLNATFDGIRWLMEIPEAKSAGELRALKLTREVNREAHVTLAGMNVRAILPGSVYRQDAVSE